MKLSTRSRGKIAILKVQLRANEKDLLVSVPLDDQIYYDLILDNYFTKEIKRVQVKWCNRLHGNNLELRLDSRSSKRIHYLSTNIDWILVYVSKIDKILKYEKKHFHRKKRLTININKPSSPWHYSRFVW